MSEMTVFGEHDENTIKQMEQALQDERAVAGVIAADGHQGYSFPIGGIVAYREAISPSGVGYDIGCGNMAVKLNVNPEYVKQNIAEIMDAIYAEVPFGLGRKTDSPRDDHPLFASAAWNIEAVAPLKQMAIEQLGTVGSGNHFVDVFIEDDFLEGKEYVWVGVHFGSRGLGHKIATHYIQAGGGKDGIMVTPVVLDVRTQLGAEYLEAMQLACDYASIGRRAVIHQVVSIIGGNITDIVHNHHNFAQEEKHFGEYLYVVRKGSTPCFPGQRSFIGGSMGDCSVIVSGKDTEQAMQSLRSVPHGAGRLISRTRAAGKSRFVGGKKVHVTEGEISKEMMMQWVNNFGVELRGAGTDESPHCYRRLDAVLEKHFDSIAVEHILKPIGVAMAGEDVYDPWKD